MAQRHSYLTTAALVPLLLFVPAAMAIASLAYTGSWSFQLNCALHDTCLGVHPDFVRLHGDNLSAFYRHQTALTGAWTEKEISHLTEVRGLLDRVMLGLLIALPALLVLWRSPAMHWAAVINLCLLLPAFLLLPLFAPFWAKVFHPLLFDNLLWKNSPLDASWYVMPRVYFRNATGYTLLMMVLGNAGLWWLARRQTARLPKP